MKYLKRIITAILFFAGLLFLLVVASQVVTPKMNTEESGMEELIANGVLGEPEDSIDVLFLGDSEVYCAVNPMQIWDEKGYTSYNCGSPSQRLCYSLILLHRVCEKQSPKIVFLETGALYREQSAGILMYTMLGETLPVFQYHDRWKNLSKEDFYETPEYSWFHQDKGFRFSIDANPCDDENYMEECENKDAISWKNKMFVQWMKEYCDENDIKFVLFSVPSTVNWNSARHNGVTELAEELDCEYIDMNMLTEEIPIDWETDTRDKGDHLNYYGAQKVSAYLSEYLTESGLVEPHTDDPYYDSWHKCYEEFLEEMSRYY